MEGREDARVVTLSSTAHRIGRISFDNLERRAPLLPLARLRPVEAGQPAVRARARPAAARAPDSAVKSLAAHPGYAATNLQTRRAAAASTGSS